MDDDEKAYQRQRRDENRSSRYADVGSVSVLGVAGVVAAAAGIVWAARWCAGRRE